MSKTLELTQYFFLLRVHVQFFQMILKLVEQFKSDEQDNTLMNI